MQSQAAVQPDEDDRPMKQAMWRGWRKRCPNCGEGHILFNYLKVRDACPECGEELHHHRADDGPAYLTILVVGHLLAPVLHISFVHWRPDPLVLALTLSTLTVALALFLLPRLKGVLIGIQWSRRMHGFDQSQIAQSPAQSSV